MSKDDEEQVFRLSVYMPKRMYKKIKKLSKQAGVNMSQYMKMALTDKWNNGCSSPKGEPQPTTSPLFVHGPDRELLNELKTVLAQRKIEVDEKQLDPPAQEFNGWEPYTSKSIK